MTNRRGRVAVVFLAVAVLLATGALVAVRTLGGSGRAAAGHKGVAGLAQSSSKFWFHEMADGVDAPLSAAIGDVLYEGNTDMRFLQLTRQAARLPRTGHGWRNVGPYKGIKDIPGTGSGAELLGSVGGIGTAMAIDPSDKTGNTVYLGTIGGLYKTTDGGKTVRSLTYKKIPRESVGAVAVDPRHPRTVYLGTGVSIFTLSDDAAGTGVYVSHNGGRTWHRPARNIHGYGVNSISINPRNGHVLVGTVYGLWSSINGGKSFHKVAIPDHAKLPLGNWVTSIVRNPYKPSEVTLDVGYAFGKKVYGKNTVVAPGNGLYRSTNDGKTFTRLASNSQLTNPQASSDPLGRTSLAYSTAPGGKNVLWALVQDAGKAAGQHPGVDTPVLPVNADGNTELNGLYRSGDDGKTWSLQATAQNLTATLGSTSASLYPLDYAVGVQASYNNWILTDPKDPNRIYFGLEEAFTGEYHGGSTSFSTIEKYANACGFLTYFNTIPNNNGVSCPSAVPEYGGGTTHPDQHSAAITVTSGGKVRLYSGNDGGWWSQTAHTVSDGTGTSYQGFDNSSWTSLNKPATVLPWDVTPLQDGSYLLALQDNGVAHVLKNGTSYQVCGGDGVYVFPGPNAHSYYCGIDGQTILGTTDDFKTTINVTPADNSSGPTFLSPWYVDRTNPNHLIAAAGNVDMTKDGMKSNTYDPTDEELVSSTWQTVFTPKNPPHGYWDSSAVATRGTASYVAFCSVCRPSLGTGTAATPKWVVTKIATNVKPHCKSALVGTACWHMAASKGLPHEQISDIAIDPKHRNTIYVSLRQMIVMGADNKATGAQKVMVSHNGGRSFKDLTGNLPRADAHRIVLRKGHLYVATDVGVFTAKAGSTHWKRFGTGLPAVTYRSMRLSLDGRYLLAGAYGGGGWVYDFRHKALHQ